MRRVAVVNALCSLAGWGAGFFMGFGSFSCCVWCVRGGAALAGHRLSLEPGGCVAMKTLLKHGVLDRARKQNKEKKKN